MYKLFLTIRYLTRKAIVIFPILVVWLCVAMLIIVTSIMGGFVDRVKQVNRDITGDIVIESTSFAGFPYYAMMQAEIARIDGVEISTPVIEAFGLINVRQGNRKVQVIGLRPQEHARVTKWSQSLYYQNKAPHAALEDLSAGGFPVSRAQLVKKAQDSVDESRAQERKILATIDSFSTGGKVPGRDFNFAWLFGLIPVALLLWLLVTLSRDMGRGWRISWVILPVIGTLVLVGLGALPMLERKNATPKDYDFYNDLLEQQRAITMRRSSTLSLIYDLLPPSANYPDYASLKAALIRPPSFELDPESTKKLATGKLPPIRGVIIGVDMAAERDRRGNYKRSRPQLDLEGVLNVAPLVANRMHGSTPLSTLNAQSANVKIIDDSYTGSAEADGTCLYADFDLVQHLALMHEQDIVDPTDLSTKIGTSPARTSMLEVKLKGSPTPAQMEAVRVKIDEIVQKYFNHRDYAADFAHIDKMHVRTWDKRQDRFISAVQNEKNMITFILGLLSLVVLVVVFLIFYIIVREKTRDIGIIKAVGGSEWGVTAIFAFYGAVIGIIGGVAGVLTGVSFVTHTNEIHEWLYQTFGVVIWRRDVYMFDRIPDTYNEWEVGLYFGIAIVAGVLGAMIPALIAGFSNPIRALRHE
jgi:ABC-type lipoprotein release transport system permease subunit